MNIKQIAQFIKLPGLEQLTKLQNKKELNSNRVKDNKLSKETQCISVPRSNNISFEIPIGIEDNKYTILDLSKEE